MAKKIDLTGQRFGRLVVVKEAAQRGVQRYWECVCDCGNSNTVSMISLRQGTTKSCGCLSKEVAREKGIKNSKDLKGKTFGRITVLESTKKRVKRKIVWRCLCECGNEVMVHTTNLTKGKVRSCGCLKKEKSRLNADFMRESENFKIFNELNSREKGTKLNSIKSTRKLNKNNKSGVRGVSWNKKRKEWKSQLMIKGNLVLNKSFKNKQDAINARKEAEIKYFKPILEKYK